MSQEGEQTPAALQVSLGAVEHLTSITPANSLQVSAIALTAAHKTKLASRTSQALWWLFGGQVSLTAVELQ